MVHSLNKGKAGERELAKELTELFGTACKRGQQYSGLGGDDVVGLPGVHAECKRVEKLSIENAVGQAVKDAQEHETPVVFHRRNRGVWLATVRLDDLPALVGKLYLLLVAKQS